MPYHATPQSPPSSNAAARSLRLGGEWDRWCSRLDRRGDEAEWVAEQGPWADRHKWTKAQQIEVQVGLTPLVPPVGSASARPSSEAGRWFRPTSRSRRKKRASMSSPARSTVSAASGGAASAAEDVADSIDALYRKDEAVAGKALPSLVQTLRL